VTNDKHYCLSLDKSPDFVLILTQCLQLLCTLKELEPIALEYEAFWLMYSNEVHQLGIKINAGKFGLVEHEDGQL
jgi:hypothetical protein